MSEENLKEGGKKKRVLGWKSVVLATIITIALFCVVSFMVIYLLPLEKTYDTAYLQMDVNEKMPDDYFPTLLKLNKTFLEEYGGARLCGYVYNGSQSNVVGYECKISFEKKKPTREEIWNHLLTHRCLLRYEKDTAWGVHFKILAPKTCMVTLSPLIDVEGHKLCTYDEEGGIKGTCVAMTGFENKILYRPTDKIALVNSTGFVTNITVPFQEKMEIWVR